MARRRSQGGGGYNEYEDAYAGGGSPAPQRQAASAPAQTFDLDDEIPF